MSERFFVDRPITNEQAVLHGPEAHHLLHVMRAKVGEEVILFDGSGSEFAARVMNLGKAQVELQVLSSTVVNRESAIELTLAVALPKGDRQKWLVEKAVELGVTRIVPLTTKRSVAEASASALDRLRRTVIEASKQSGRNRLLEIGDPQDWRQAVQSLAPEGLRILADPGGKPLGAFWPRSEKTATLPPIVAAIGPEGGFTDEEINLAQSTNWTRVGLGPRILRVETAALAIAAWILASTGDQPPPGSRA
jgi:16S rRNA (uracil1498-N3)-methyltransferase